MLGRRLSNYGKLKEGSDTLRLGDIEGQDVVVNSATIHQGDKGEFVVLKITLPDGGDVVVVTGGFLIVDAIKAVMAEEGFPLGATFSKSGRTWVCE